MLEFGVGVRGWAGGTFFFCAWVSGFLDFWISVFLDFSGFRDSGSFDPFHFQFLVFIFVELTTWDAVSSWSSPGVLGGSGR